MSLATIVGVAEGIPGVRREEKGFVLRIGETDDPLLASPYMPSTDAAARLAATSRLLSGALQAGLLTLSLTPRPSDGSLAVTLVPGENCGFATLRDNSGRLHIEILPKVSRARMFALLALAGDPRSHFLMPPAELATETEGSLVELLMESYALALRQLLRSSGLRGLHESQEQKLRYRVRGKVLIPEYLRELSAGRPFSVPCRYPVHTLDNAVNRILRSALRMLLRAAEEAGPSAVELEKLDSVFSGIGVPRVTEQDLRQTSRLPESFSQYFASGALPLARYIVRNLHLSTMLGDVKSVSVAFPMHDIFERAFARLVARRSERAVSEISQREWPIRAGAAAGDSKPGTFKPDVVLPPDDHLAGLIADTKWKTCLERGTKSSGEAGKIGSLAFSLRGIALYNADIFQILAYLEAARHIHEGTKFVAALIYPVADLKDEDLVPVQMSIVGSASGKPLPLYLIPWDVGRECIRKSQILWDHIHSIRITA